MNNFKFFFFSLLRNPCVIAGSMDCLLWRIHWCWNDTLMRNYSKSTADTMMMLMYVLYFHWLKLGVFFLSFYNYSFVEMRFYHYLHWSKLDLMIIFIAQNQVPSFISLVEIRINRYFHV